MQKRRYASQTETSVYAYIVNAGILLTKLGISSDCSVLDLIFLCHDLYENKNAWKIDLYSGGVPTYCVSPILAILSFTHGYWQTKKLTLHEPRWVNPKPCQVACNSVPPQIIKCVANLSVLIIKKGRPQRSICNLQAPPATSLADKYAHAMTKTIMVLTME